ncbi:MAG: isocitrate lyase/PEP mutase family protein [Burkholderiales bacterium]
MKNQRSAFRNLLRTEDMVVLPGAYDVITARLIERAGYQAVYMTGAGTAAISGYPDYGLATMSEMVQNASRITGAINIPLISDADTGYGNELNAIRTVREFERAGAAGIHIEDQVFPKKCGHLDNKQLIPFDDYLVKIRAAADAKEDPDFLIIARTDSRASLGFEEAVRRCNLAIEHGADMVFLEAPQTMEEVLSVPKLVKGPCLLNVVRGGKSPNVTFEQARQAGYKVAIVPGLLMTNVVATCENLLEEMKQLGAHPKFAKELTVRELFSRFGADEWDPLRERYSR